jgi:PKD repeat protein
MLTVAAAKYGITLTANADLTAFAAAVAAERGTATVYDIRLTATNAGGSDFETKVDYVTATGSSAATITAGTQLAAYANNGRWVGECITCDAGVAASPDFTGAFCFECLTSYATVVFPTDRTDIEDALVVRPSGDRNWDVGQSVGTLMSDNQTHGWTGR